MYGTKFESLRGVDSVKQTQCATKTKATNLVQLNPHIDVSSDAFTEHQFIVIIKISISAVVKFSCNDHYYFTIFSPSMVHNNERKVFAVVNLYPKDNLH